MPVYLALLRGVNVSGKNIIRMEDLRKRMEAAGYATIKTFIQSGNILFTSGEKSTDAIGRKLEAFLKQEYGYDITVFILTKAELVDAIDKNPYDEEELRKWPDLKSCM